MLKLVFLLLLLANGVLFAFHQGYLEAVSPSGHEPERMKNQLNAEKIKQIALPVAAPAAETPAETVASDAQPGNENETSVLKAACIEIGSFTASEARRFETQLASLPLLGKATRLEVAEPSSHMVLIPPQNDKAGADKKVAELRSLGVTDYYVLQDPPNPELRWGVSLGIFKSEEAARAYLTQMSQRGVRSARLIAYKTPMKKFAFQLPAGAQTAAGIDKLKSAFPSQQVRNCPEANAG
jgi:hypothetical protein